MDAEQAANLAAYFTENVLEKVSAALASGDGVSESLAGDLEYLQADFADRLSALVGVDKSAPVDVSVLKVDEEQRMVWGWGSVTTMKGEPVTDRQGDVIDTEDMQKAVHQYIRDYRVGATMHKRNRRGEAIQTGDIVDSIFFTKAVQDALGIDLGVEGWFVGKYVADDATWKRYQNGELKAFSFGGTGTRVPLDTSVTKFNQNHGSDGKFSGGGSGGAGAPLRGGSGSGGSDVGGAVHPADLIVNGKNVHGAVIDAAIKAKLPKTLHASLMGDLKNASRYTQQGAHRAAENHYSDAKEMIGAFQRELPAGAAKTAAIAVQTQLDLLRSSAHVRSRKA